MTTISTTSNPVTLDSFTCPGHEKFFHHYSIYDKAKRKAQVEVDLLIARDDEVESATYRVIEKDSIEGKESGYFSRLNSIYKYAVMHTFFHANGSFTCSHIREQYAKALAERSLICSPKELGDITQKAEDMAAKIL